jgi:hypothetical protein
MRAGVGRAGEAASPAEMATRVSGIPHAAEVY